MTMERSNCGSRDPNINNNRDLPDYSIKAANLQPAVLLTPKLSSTFNMFQNPVSTFNQHHHQMVPVVTPSESGRCCFYSNKQPAAAAPARTSRWNPTPEQIIVLEDLYRSGMKTPTAQQIRQVTARLRNYGRIECKNVFYWFQNHRARERQKRRREVMYQSDSKQQQQQQQQQQQTLTTNTITGLQDKKYAGVDFVRRLEVEQPNKWTLQNCTVLSDQESSSVLQERLMSMVKRNSSDSPGPTSDTNASAGLTYTKLLDVHNCYHCHDDGMVTAPEKEEEQEQETRETQTLELFPLKSENLKGAEDIRVAISRATSTDTTADFLADQYYLFL